MEIQAIVKQGIRTGCSDWKRSRWLLAGIMLGIGFYIGVSSIGLSYTELVRIPFSRIESDLLVQLGTRGTSVISGNKSSIRLPFSNQEIDTKAVHSIGALKGVKDVDTAILLWHQQKKNFITISGLDPGTTGRGPAMVLQWIKEGRSLHNSGEAVVESHYARFHKIRPGDTVHLGTQSFKIVGISKIKEGAALAAANFYIGISDARNLAGLHNASVNLLSLRLHPGTDEELLKQQIQTVLPGALVSSTDSIGEMMQGFARISAAGAHLLSSIALVFSLLFACWLIIGRQEELQWQVGLLQTMGWQRKDILLRSGAELFTISAIGAAGGLLLGSLTILLIGNMEISLTLPWNLAPTPEGMHRTMGENTLQIPLPVIFQPLLYATAFTAACLTAVCSGVWITVRITGRGIRKTLFEQK